MWWSKRDQMIKEKNMVENKLPCRILERRQTVRGKSIHFVAIWAKWALRHCGSVPARPGSTWGKVEHRFYSTIVRWNQGNVVTEQLKCGNCTFLILRHWTLKTKTAPSSVKEFTRKQNYFVMVKIWMAQLIDLLAVPSSSVVLFTNHQFVVCLGFFFWF